MFTENPHKNVHDHADDEVLWEQIRNGDKMGMECLYVKYSQQLFRLGMSIKNDRSFIKDCIHEVFVNIWGYRNSLKATDNVKLYLFKCLSNKIHKEVGKLLVFKKTPLLEAVMTLENWYGVSFEIQNKPNSAVLFSGKFDNETLEIVLEGLSYAAKFDFEINEDKVKIRF